MIIGCAYDQITKIIPLFVVLCVYFLSSTFRYHPDGNDSSHYPVMASCKALEIWYVATASLVSFLSHVDPTNGTIGTRRHARSSFCRVSSDSHLAVSYSPNSPCAHATQVVRHARQVRTPLNRKVKHKAYFFIPCPHNFTISPVSRGTLYGLSAAIGKVGAAVGTQAFTPIQNNLGKKCVYHCPQGFILPLPRGHLAHNHFHGFRYDRVDNDILMGCATLVVVL